MNLSEKIKVVAREHGKTVSSLAEKMGRLQPHLSRTINNERITLKDLEEIASAIGCSVSDFFCENINLGKSKSPTIICPHCGKEIHLEVK